MKHLGLSLFLRAFVTSFQCNCMSADVFSPEKFLSHFLNSICEQSTAKSQASVGRKKICAFILIKLFIRQVGSAGYQSDVAD